MTFVQSTAFMFANKDNKVVMSGVPEDGINLVSVDFATLPKSVWKFVDDDRKEYGAVFPGIKEFRDEGFTLKLPGELFGEDVDGKTVVAIVVGSEGMCRGMTAFIQHA